MKEPDFESLDEMADFTATNLADVSAHMAFRLFRDKRFRQLAEFDKLSQAEHDRIFNELVLANLIMIMLILEAPDLRIEKEFRGYLRDLHEKLPKAYVKNLEKLGIEPEHLRDWDKLIAMRYEEYAKDRHNVRAAAMQLESEDRDISLADLSGIQIMLPVEAVAIGCHHHVCRGKTEGRDELFKAMLRSLSKFYVQIRIPLEGGKITPLTRARVALKRIFRRKRRT